MSEGFHLGYGIDTTYPKIDEDGIIHIDPYVSIDSDEDSIYFLGREYRPLVESEL